MKWCATTQPVIRLGGTPRPTGVRGEEVRALVRAPRESPIARSLYFLEAFCSTKFFEEPNKSGAVEVPIKRADKAALLWGVVME